jgi:hypothetical protein
METLTLDTARLERRNPCLKATWLDRLGRVELCLRFDGLYLHADAYRDRDPSEHALASLPVSRGLEPLDPVGELSDDELRVIQSAIPLIFSRQSVARYVTDRIEEYRRDRDAGRLAA